MLSACIRRAGVRESRHARKLAMPDFVLIAVGALVPILALTLALACGQARDDADIGEGLGDDARS